MANRDASDIVLQTLRYNLANATTGVVNYNQNGKAISSGISSGYIWLQYAVDDYVNGRTFEKMPSMGICEVGKAKIKYQNYGCTQMGAVNTDGSYRIYSPLGEKDLMIQVDIWCTTKAERRAYNAAIESFLLQNKSLTTSVASDPVTGDSIYIEFIDYEMSEDKPYMTSFFLNVQVGIYKEEDAFTADTIEIRGKMSEGLAIDTSASGSPWIVITSGGIAITGQPSV
jgi:hypothetical protein